MDLYTLNSEFHKEHVIDVFTSLIWTERYNDVGEVTLVVPSESEFLDYLFEGVYLSIPESDEVMIVETISTEDSQTTIAGKSLVSILSSRMVRDTYSNAKDSWLIAGIPGAIAAYMVTQMCQTGGKMATGDILPTALGLAETIPHLGSGPHAGGTSITVAVPYGVLFDAVKSICDLDSIGFHLYPNVVTPTFYSLTFSTYRGRDLTTDQSTYPVVIFEPALDSFADIKEVRSIAGYKTHAYAWAAGATAQNQIGSAVAPGATGSESGFTRRTMMVDASDVNVADYPIYADLIAVLNQKCRDALANNNYVRMTDGQIVPQNAFTYGTDYTLGDIIELRGTSNTAQSARITEYIRAQDSTGERAYPTLSVIG